MKDAMPALSTSLERFPVSRISQIFSLATRLKGEGRDIIDLSIGEPQFDTPDHIKQAAWQAIQAGDTKYTSVEGTKALREAIQRKFARDNGLDYGLDQIVVTSGAKPLIFYGLQAMLDAGDEVLIPTPCWTSYPGMVQLAGGEAVLLPTAQQDGFKLRAADLAEAITPKSKCLLLCSPSNPTGAAYSADELKALGDVLAAHPELWVISDDLYEHIVFDGFDFSTLAALEPRLGDRVLTINGVSKAYAMTGWRIGYAGGPKDLISAIVKIMSQSTGSPAAMSQAAALAALDGPQDFLKDWAARYQARRDLAVDGLNAIPGLRAAKPEGSFYVFPHCGGLLGKTTPQGKRIEDSQDLVRHLLEDWGVALVPGAAFEADPYFRMSCASSEADIAEGLRRIAAAAAALG
jgi:aspartate aminotransferase